MAPAGLFLGSICSQQCCAADCFSTPSPTHTPELLEMQEIELSLLQDSCDCLGGAGQGAWFSKALSWEANAKLAGVEGGLSEPHGPLEQLVPPGTFYSGTF